jgi:hypothetical protein
MNVNEITPKTNARLNRIQKVSKCIRLLLQYGFPMMVIAALGLGYLSAAHIITLPKLNSADTASNSMPPPASFQLQMIVDLIVYFFWYRTALQLFGFFEKGILFTADTVRCIQVMGVIYCARFLVQLGFYLLAPASHNHWLASGLSNLFTGFLIFFIGWMLDEARKIREEQELTV